jgi:hypothetical protein
MRRWKGCPKGGRASRDCPTCSSTGSTGSESGAGVGAYAMRTIATGMCGAHGQDTGCEGG